MPFIFATHLAIYWILRWCDQSRKSIKAQNGSVKFSSNKPDKILELITTKINQAQSVDSLIKKLKELLVHLIEVENVLVFVIESGNHFMEIGSKRRVTQQTRNRLYFKNWKVQTLSETDWLVVNQFYSTSEEVILFPVFKSFRSGNGLLFTIKVPDDRIIRRHIITFLHLHATATYKKLIKERPSICQGVNNDLSCLLHLCGDLNEKDPISMQMKVISYICERTNADKCCILLVEKEMGHFLCQVSSDDLHKFDSTFPLTQGLFGEVYRSKKPCLIEDFTHVQKNDLLSLESLLSKKMTSCVVVPVISHSTKEVIAIVCASNNRHNEKFTSEDVDLITLCLQYTWTVLTSALALKKERKAKGEFQAMLNIAQNLFTRLDDVSILLGQIIQEARDLTNAERCSVFLVDNESRELVAKVFDGISSLQESFDPKQYDFKTLAQCKGMNEVRLPLNQGIAGHVATTGEILNIRDAYSHPLFYRGIDETTGFKTRNILCFPIHDHNSVVVGVSQLCNKINGDGFTKYDEELSLLYKEVIESNCRSQLANELMTYHMKVRDEDVEFCLENLPSDIRSFHEDFDQFHYPPRTLNPDKTITATVQMFVDLGLVSRFHISTKTLSRFVIMVKQGYRDPPYHNWDHAFSVAHHSYLLAKNLNLCNVIGPLETLALVAGSLCHDLDHRGTNNAFQVSSKSVLSNLYSSEGSVLEHHHFAQAMSILNIGNSNIFESLTKTEYVSVLDMMKQIILATDLRHHLDILPALEDMSSRKIDPARCSQQEKNLLICLLMTSSDISDQMKDWETTKSTAKLVYKEFFSQGDMEKSMGSRPELINDRNRACVPQLQINFMEHIARPVYRILSILFPKYLDSYHRFENNVNSWKLVLEEFQRLNMPTESSLDFLTKDFDDRIFNRQ